jgi:hypothetical protein
MIATPNCRVRFGVERVCHLGLQHLVQDRLQQDRHSSVALEQLLDLLITGRNLKGGQPQWVGWFG